MIISIFIHTIENGISREVCNVNELRAFVNEVGWERIEKILITDFRPIMKTLPDGKKEVLCPDF